MSKMANKKRLIYMDDTMDRLRAYAERKHQTGQTELANGILKAVNYIHNEISRVDAVEVVHGRWENPDGIHSCSVCGKSNPYEVLGDNIWYWPCKYCPNCGAKMDGVGNA